MESEGNVMGPCTVNPLYAVTKPEVTKLPFNDKSSLISNLLVVKVLMILLFVNAFTVRFPRIVILPPIFRLPFIDESPDTKSFPLREESLLTTESPAFKVCRPEDTISGAYTVPVKVDPASAA